MTQAETTQEGAATAAPVNSGWSDKPITRAELLPRIESAIKRITSGSGSMRVPAESDDPDLVLADCAKLLNALPLPLPKRPAPGLLMSMAIRYDHGLGHPGYYDQLAKLGLGHGITHQQRVLATLGTMRQIYEEVSGHGFYSPEREDHYAGLATDAAGVDVGERDLTHADLQLSIQIAALKLVEMASDNGVIVTIERRRTPDARPGAYVVETRPTRAVYSKPQEAAK